MNEIERLQDRVRELRHALEKQTSRADKAEGEASSLRFESSDLRAKVKGFEDARAASAIPEPGPTERDLGYEAGLERAIARIVSLDLPSPFEAMCVSALTEDLHTAECDTKPIGGRQVMTGRSKVAMTDEASWVRGFVTALAEMHRQLAGGNDSPGVQRVAKGAGVTLALARKCGCAKQDVHELERACVVD
jgi:hypothetical protein